MDFKTAEKDRILLLEQRIIEMKKESRDMAFNAYLDNMWNETKKSERMILQIEQDLEHNYRKYLNNQQMRYGQSVSAQPMMRQNQTNQPEMARPVWQNQTNQPEMARQVWQNQTNQPEMARQVWQNQTNQPEMARQVWQNQTNQPEMARQVWQNQTNQPEMVRPVQQNQVHKPQETVEFKVGTVIFGVVGIVFLLIAFITFGLNFMNNVLQGIFLYAVGILLIALSEGLIAKRLEKFSYCLTGLGISSLYATTIINYIYLKIFPAWVALLITVFVTAFFFYLSRKKDSGMIRIICLIGCYICLMPVGCLKNVWEFLLPAIVIFAVNVAGIYCPVKKRHKAVDMVQYICTFVVLFYLIYLEWLSGLEMWPVYILVCANVLTLHLLYFKTEEETAYRFLYFIGQGIHLVCLWYIGHHEYFLHFGMLGVMILCAALTALLWKKKIRFAPYFFFALYGIFGYLFEGEAFWFCLICLLVFCINKCLVRFFREFPVPDTVYTLLSAAGVCLFARSGEVQIPGYLYAAAILLSCIFVNKFKKYHIIVSLTFGWLFLLTEGFQPFLCSILICILATAAIAAGFWWKDKGVRIYGLVLMICVALKLVIFDFYESEAAIRILVFLVVGLFILGTSFFYLYLEKKQEEEERQKLQGNEQGNPQAPELNL